VYVDGKMVASTSDDTTPALNTAQLGNGEHIVSVKKTDVNGAVAESAQTIDVNNSLFTQVLGQMTTKTGKLITIGLVLTIGIVVILIYKKMPLPFLPKS
jgi:hypothetical protein